MDSRILTKHAKARYKGERLHMLQYPGVCQIFILACIAADAATLYTLFDSMLTQQTAISWIITLTVATAMNIAPMLLAAALRNEELPKRMKTVFCTLLGCLFILLFGVTFALRYSSQEQLYGSGSDLDNKTEKQIYEFLSDSNTDDSSSDDNESIKISNSDEDEFVPTTGQKILAGIFGLEPLATSICSFVLAYETSPKRKRQYLHEMQAIELEETIDHDKVMLEELKADLEFDLNEYDKIQFEETLRILKQQGELAKNTAVRKLSEHEATPESVSFLMEGQYMDQKKEEELAGSVLATNNPDETSTKRMKSIA